MQTNAKAPVPTIMVESALLRTNNHHIQALRKTRGLSQEEVGNILDMDRVSIGYIEQGKRAPKLSTLYALADVFGIDIKDFFEFD